MWERIDRSEDVGDWIWTWEIGIAFCDTPYIFLYTAYSSVVDGKSFRIPVHFLVSLLHHLELPSLLFIFIYTKS